MSAVRFYHLTRSNLEQALPQMLRKTLERGKRATVRLGSAERVESLNTWLWSGDERGFLPHGSAKDGQAERQPIWLTAEDEVPNGAAYLFVADGAPVEGPERFELISLLFDGSDEAALSQARDTWRRLKSEGHELTYLQQDEAGRWKEKDLG